MSIRLEHLRIQRGGPLLEDFEFEPGDLNLIYGRNETGKTYLVEAIIRILFSKGTRSQEAWGLREWDLKGRINITGLQKEAIPFTTTGDKLGQYWQKELGLPPDLARLLVVKSSEVILDPAAGDQMLRNYLSGNALLEQVGKNISTTIQNAEVVSRRIQGAKRGELQTRKELENNCSRVKKLLNEAEGRYASGERNILRQEINLLEEERARLKIARRYRAGVLNQELNEQKSEFKTLPDAQSLATLSGDVAVYQSKVTDIAEKEEKITALETATEDFQWTDSAIETYRAIADGEKSTQVQPVFLIMAFVCMVGTVFAGYHESESLMIMAAVLAAGLVGLYYWKARLIISRAGENVELDRLREEFNRRFSEPLADRSTLEAKHKYLSSRNTRCELLRGEVDNDRNDFRILQMQTAASLKQYWRVDCAPDDWPNVLIDLRERAGRAQEQMRDLEKEIGYLDVNEGDYLDRDPGFDWDPQRYQEVGQLIEERETEWKELTKALDQLKTDVLHELELNEGEWEELIEKLGEHRDNKVRDYRQATANILGKIQVWRVIEDLKELESERIAEAVGSEVVKALLRKLTGRYIGIRLDEDGSLVLLEEYDECPLSMVSTGTREQVFLALRVGFASHVMKGETGFLILDDAFQNSDWQRREYCLQALIDLVGEGWQVFYFAMDDHIRDLFCEAGKELGDRFKMKAL